MNLTAGEKSFKILIIHNPMDPKYLIQSGLLSALLSVPLSSSSANGIYPERRGNYFVCPDGSATSAITQVDMDIGQPLIEGTETRTDAIKNLHRRGRIQSIESTIYINELTDQSESLLEALENRVLKGILVPTAYKAKSWKPQNFDRYDHWGGATFKYENSEGNKMTLRLKNEQKIDEIYDSIVDAKGQKLLVKLNYKGSWGGVKARLYCSEGNIRLRVVHRYSILGKPVKKSVTYPFGYASLTDQYGLTIQLPTLFVLHDMVIRSQNLKGKESFDSFTF